VKAPCTHPLPGEMFGCGVKRVANVAPRLRFGEHCRAEKPEWIESCRKLESNLFL